jgi:tetratricopeptide (TPR) repeat protein
LAALKQAQGHLDEAERLYRRALGIKEKLLGSIHPDVAMTLNNMAVLSKTRGRYIEAESMYRRAMAIFEQSLGTAHPKVIICRKNFASLMRKMEQQPPQPIRDL